MVEIRSTLLSCFGQELEVTYKETDPLELLEDRVLHCVHAYCFYQDQMIIVRHPINGWTPPGGGIEDGESYQAAVVREVKEEVNARVVKQLLIGFIDAERTDKQIRLVRTCCIVEPLGQFRSDKDEEITELKLIKPEDYRQYFDWGEIGERMMERAVVFKERLKEI